MTTHVVQSADAVTLDFAFEPPLPSVRGSSLESRFKRGGGEGFVTVAGM